MKISGVRTMADEIRKVGIEITAEGAKEFAQSMKDIKAATSEAYSELKLAQSQYDKNTSVTKKLEDRQKYLTTATEQYTKKAALLEGELKELESAENKDETAIAKKRTELNKCNAKLEEYKKALGDVNDKLKNHSAQLQEWGSKLQAVGGKMTDVGKNLTTHVTAPIAAVGAASTAAWKEVDEAMDTVTKKTGASGEALEDMQKRAKNLAESIPTDFQTAADAVGEVNTRFGLTGDALEDLSGKFIEYAKLNDTDVSSSIDSVQAAMAAWNLKAEDAGKVLDTLNKCGQDTGISVDKLSDMLKSNKTALDEAGMSFSDAAVFLANMDKNGIDASTAMTGLKKTLQNATKEGKTSSEALKELQDELSNSTDKTDAYAKATALFGAKAGPAIADACMEGRLSFEELGTSMDDFAGNVSNTFDETVSPLDKFQMSLNTMKDLGYEIVEAAAPLILEVMEKLKEGATALKEKWDSLSDNQKESIIRIAAIVAAIGPVLAVLGTVISTIGTIMTVVGVAMSVIGAPLLATIAAVVAAIVAAIAIGVALYKNWDKIKKGAEDFVNGVKQKWDDFKKNTAETFNSIKNGAAEKVAAMRDAVKDRIDSLKQAAGDKWTAIKDKTSDTIESMKEAVTGKFESVKEKAKSIFDVVKDVITDPIGSAKDFISGAISDISSLFANAGFEFPDIKLPHFSWDWIDIGGIVSIPSISIDWYRKAYSEPYMFTSPTVVGSKGFGDGPGGEMVYGHDNLMADIKDAVKSGGGGTFAPVINIYTREGQSNEEIAQYVIDTINREYARAGKAYA